MTRIKMHISNVKLPFYPPCEVKYGLQNRVSTGLLTGCLLMGQYLLILLVYLVACGCFGIALG